MLNKRRHDTQLNDIQHIDVQHNDPQHNDTQQNDTKHNAQQCCAECPVMLSVKYKPCMLRDVMLNVIMLSVVAPNINLYPARLFERKTYLQK
jgi:hypothetical protein